MIPRLGVDMNVAAGIHAAGGIKIVTLAGIKVVGSVSGRGMDRAGTGIGGDVCGEHAQNAALQERMPEGDAVERGTIKAGNNIGLRCGAIWLSFALQLAIRNYFAGQLVGRDINPSIAIQRNVLKIGVESDGQRSGQ